MVRLGVKFSALCSWLLVLLLKFYFQPVNWSFYCRECLQKCRDVPAYLKHQCIAVKCRKNYDLIDPEKRLPDTTLYEYESSLLSPERNLDVNLEKIPKRESVARKAFLTGLDFRRGDIKVPAVRKRLMIGTLATCIALKCGGLQDELKDLCGVSQCHNSEKW